MSRRANLLTVLALALIGVGAFAVGFVASRQTLGEPGVKLSNIPLIGDEGRLVKTNSVALPTLVNGYEFKTLPISDLELTALPADTVFGRGVYTAPDGFWAQLNVVLMGTDRTSIHRPEYCLEGVGWRIMRQQERPLEELGQPSPRVQRFDCRINTVNQGKRVDIGGVYVFWFVAQNQRTASHWQRQWWMIRDLVTRGVLQRWAYVSVFAPCTPGQEDEAYRRITQLIKATSPYFQVTNDMAIR